MRLPLGGGRDDLGVCNRGNGDEDGTEPAIGGRGHCKRLPARDSAFDRGQRASKQQAGCKDDCGTSALVQDKPCGGAHDQDLRKRPRGFGDQHDDLIAAFGYLMFVACILRGLVDKPGGAIEHSHGPDHVDVSDGHAEPSVGPRQRGNRSRQWAFGDEVAGKCEAAQHGRAGGADQPEQGMHEEKNAEKERRPEHVEQHRAGAGLGELAQGHKIAIGLRRARLIGLMGVFEAGRDHRRTELIFEPRADPAQRGAA